MKKTFINLCYYIVFITIISALFGFIRYATAFEHCSGACGTLHHKKAKAVFGFKGDNGIEYTEPTPFVLTGFGYGLASDNIVLPPGSPNPQLQFSTANWVDFRFYASFPGVGLVKGSLNENHTSYVSLSALTEDGLFPAEFINNMFIKLEPLAYPGLVYENTEVLQLYAPSVSSAPPDSSIVTTQIGTDVFRVVGSPPPGAPVEIIFKDGIQNFLEPNTGLNLRLLSSPDDKLMKFRIKNLLDTPVTVVYFLYFNGDSDLANKIQNYDGVIKIDSQSYSEFSFDISDIPDTTPENAIVLATILEPIGLKGADLWVGDIPCYVELSYFTSTVTEKGDISLSWETSAEIRNAGFRLWRATKNQYGGYTNITLLEETVSNQDNTLVAIGIDRLSKLINAKGNSREGASYSYVDTCIDKGETYYYLLENVDMSGKRTFHWGDIVSTSALQGTGCDYRKD